MARLVRVANIEAAEAIGELFADLAGRDERLDHLPGGSSQPEEIVKLTIKRVNKALRNFSKEVHKKLRTEAKWEE